MRPIYIEPFLPPSVLDSVEQELLSLKWETKRTARHEYFMADGKVCDSCDGKGVFNDGHWRSGPTGRACVKCGGSKRLPINYSYGRRDDGISYVSKPWSPLVDEIRDVVSMAVLGRLGPLNSGGRYTGYFNGCFLNKYDDQHQHLGWHADDFAGMDPDAPIAVMSFGAEREIWIKPQSEPCPVATCVDGRAFKEGMMLTCLTCNGKGRVAVKGAVPPEDRFLLQRGSLFIMPPGFQEVMLHRIPKHPQPCGWRISLTFRKFL